VKKRNLLLLGLALLLVGLAIGCKKPNETSSALAPANATGTDPGTPSGPAPPSSRGPGPSLTAPAPAVIQEQADPDAALAQLSTELRKYVVRTRSVPKNFEDFLAKSQVQAPPPPAGKKYAIQNQAVVLIKR
jgi:hypothetical protein